MSNKDESIASSAPAQPAALSWPLPPSEVALADNEVQVWGASLIQPVGIVEKLEQVLSDDERSRAKRFCFPRDQQAFAVGRGVLRRILACYLGSPAKEIAFSYSPRGKPFLADGAARLRFNMAHSKGLALFAVTRDAEIGIDVEGIRPIAEMEAIARRFFASGETAKFLSLPEAQWPQAFFNCWTRKEAYLKATGMGISHGLDQFEVSLEPGAPAALLNHKVHPEEIGQWELSDLRPAPGYVAALAVRGKALKLHCWQWDGTPGC